MSAKHLEALKEHRKALVLAAGQVVSKCLPDSDSVKKWNKSQLPKLSAVCAQAECAEEIESYLRYQAARRNPPWPHEVVKALFRELEPILKGLTDHDKVSAWLLFSTYLTREYTYRAFVLKEEGGR